MQPPEDQLLRRYLLGTVTETERAQIEDRLFADDEFHEHLLALKSELADEYVRGELSATERAQYAARFLSSAAGRQRVAFAKAMEAALPVSSPTLVPPVIAEEKPSWWQSVIAFWRVPALQFALAAAVLLLAFGSLWLYRERARLHSELEVTRAEQLRQQQQQQESQRQLDEQRKRSEQLAADLARAQAERERLAQEVRPPQPATPLSFLTFTLLPGVSRAGGAPETLVIPRAMQQVRLRLNLDGDDRAARYRVELRTMRGQLVWRRQGLTARGPTVTLLMPAALLTKGEYELALQTQDSPGQFTDVGFYYVQVVRK